MGRGKCHLDSVQQWVAKCKSRASQEGRVGTSSKSSSALAVQTKCWDLAHQSLMASLNAPSAATRLQGSKVGELSSCAWLLDNALCSSKQRTQVRACQVLPLNAQKAAPRPSSRVGVCVTAALLSLLPQLLAQDSRHHMHPPGNLPATLLACAVAGAAAAALTTLGHTWDGGPAGGCAGVRV